MCYRCNWCLEKDIPGQATASNGALIYFDRGVIRMKVITIDPERCIGCRNCEYACSFKQNYDFLRTDSRIRVNIYPEDRVCIPLACVHCSIPYCLELCPAGAIARNYQTGTVEIDKERCVGCKMCMLACPFGCIIFDPKEQVSKKCDLCQGDPNCVKFCISGALQFVEVEEAYQANRDSFDAKLKVKLEKEKKLGEGVNHG